MKKIKFAINLLSAALVLASCDDAEIFTENVPFASEDVYVGLLSFNTAFKAINYEFN